MTQSFTTTLTLPDETEVEVAVTYRHIKGYPASWVEPDEPDSVEIDSVVPDVPESCYADLIEQAFEDHASYLADAAEWKADMRRDDYE